MKLDHRLNWRPTLFEVTISPLPSMKPTFRRMYLLAIPWRKAERGSPSLLDASPLC
ncbi:MAG: hypothetical protein U0796_04040 [Gemmatales bacterium]